MKRWAGAMGAQAPARALQQQGTSDLPEVLELVISSTNDAALLARATMTSTYYRDLAVAQIKQHLPELLVHAIKYDKRSHHTEPGPVDWLCAAAGSEAVGLPQVAAALLSPSMVVPNISDDHPCAAGRWLWADACSSALAAAGLRLTDTLVAAVARQQLPGVRLLLEDMREARGSAALSAKTGARAAARLPPRGGLSRLAEAVVFQKPAFAQLLSEQGAGLDAQAVADLIFIACNEGAETTCVDLCDFDERNTKVLASQGHTPTPGRGPGRIVTRGQLREQQQEGQQQSAPPLQEEQQQSAPSLLEQLLLTCLVAGELGLLRYLAERTEAANLNPASVSKLMKAAALMGNRRDLRSSWSWEETTRTALDILSTIPAAKEVSSDTVYRLLRSLLRESTVTWGSRAYYQCSSESFYKLPGATKLSSQQCCSLLLLALRQDLPTAAAALARNLHCQLQHDDLMQLLLTAFDEVGAATFCEVLSYFDQGHMQVSKCLTVEDVMLLLVKVSQDSGGCNGGELVQEAADRLDFDTKAAEITDPASYRRFLEAMVALTSEEELGVTMKRVTASKKLPVLDVQEYLQLLRFCVVHRMLPRAITAMPAAKQVPVEDLWELLQLSFVDRPEPTPAPDDVPYDSDAGWPNGPCPWLVRDLSVLPAMQQLTAEQIVWLLQQTLQEHSAWCFSTLLALPAARCIEPSAAQALVLALVQEGNALSVSQLKQLCEKVPACAVAWEELDSQLLRQRLLAALNGHDSNLDGSAVCMLLQHPKLQQHAAEVLPDVLLAGFSCFGSGPDFGSIFIKVFADVRGDQSTEQGPAADKPRRLCMSAEELASLLNLPAAVGLSVSVVRQLMSYSISLMKGLLLPKLVRLPAAAQLVESDVAALLQAMPVDERTKERSAVAAFAMRRLGGSPPAGVAAGPRIKQPLQEDGALGSTAGSSQGTTSSGASLEDSIRGCFDQPKGTAIMLCLLQLPWAQQLPAELVRELLLVAAERKDKPAFDWLLQLPQAPREDAEVLGWGEALRFGQPSPAVEVLGQVSGSGVTVEGSPIRGPGSWEGESESDVVSAGYSDDEGPVDYGW